MALYSLVGRSKSGEKLFLFANCFLRWIKKRQPFFKSSNPASFNRFLYPWWLFFNFLYPYIGKAGNHKPCPHGNPYHFSYFERLRLIALTLFTLSHSVHAQCTFSDSLNKEIPNFIKGNVNQFRIHNEALQSQSLELTAHSYELSLPCTESPDSLLWEFQLELNINTSTNNRFCFGIRQADSSE
jgi:hypothetical protein